MRDSEDWRLITPWEGMAGWEGLEVMQDVDGVFWAATENGVSRIESIDASPATGTPEPE